MLHSIVLNIPGWRWSRRIGSGQLLRSRHAAASSTRGRALARMKAVTHARWRHREGFSVRNPGMVAASSVLARRRTKCCYIGYPGGGQRLPLCQSRLLTRRGHAVSARRRQHILLFCRTWEVPSGWHVSCTAARPHINVAGTDARCSITQRDVCILRCCNGRSTDISGGRAWTRSQVALGANGSPWQATTRTR